MRLFLTPIDGWLVVLVLIWGSNFSVVKVALEEFPPLAFNTLRMALATALFMASLRTVGPVRPARSDWLAFAGLGLVGHFFYQVCFMEGLIRTSVANSSIILGCTPVVVALLTLRRRHERATTVHWIGVACSLAGIYLVVGRGAALTGSSLAGDVLMLGAVVCWAVYTVGARSLLMRYSPLAVNAWSMAFGTLVYVPVGLPDLARLEWRAISLWAWGGLAFSATFALCVAYLIWYTAVQRIGSTRTSVYSNMVPVAAMIVAAIWLQEPIGSLKIVGAAAILLGVVLTKIQRS